MLMPPWQKKKEELQKSPSEDGLSKINHGSQNKPIGEGRKEIRIELGPTTSFEFYGNLFVA